MGIFSRKKKEKYDYIKVNTQSSIKMTLDKVIYFDPFKIEEESHDADIIFITHNHYDHFDKDSINKVINDNTIVVAPLSMKSDINLIKFRDYVYLNPNDETKVEDINVRAIPAYNLNKPFHARTNNWLGYLISYNGTSYYIAGDTDKTMDNERLECDFALIPIGGHYTMDVDEAAELLKVMNPKVVIPTHYGSIVGTMEDAKKLQEKLIGTNIELVEKIKG